MIPTPPATYNALDSSVPVFDAVLITTALLPIRTPPVIFTAPVPAPVANVASANVDCPCTDNVDNKFVAPVSVDAPIIVTLVPTYKSLAMPTPPLTTNAPVVVEVELVVVVNCAESVTNLTAPDVL